MYEAFYGFREKPFSLSPDPKYLFLSRSHRDALNHMRYGISQGEGFIVVAGEVGVGKTTLSRALIGQFPKTVRTALVFNPLVSEKELLEQILEEFGVIPKGRGSVAARNTKEYYDSLNEFLLKTVSAGEVAVLVLDEAQNLTLSLLEAIRLLSNFETDKGKLLQIILLGQVELLEKLKRPELVQLNQRIAIKYRLWPLREDELGSYVAHRIQVAGARTPIQFTPEAIKAISHFSGGVPRLVNLACDRALLAGFEREATVITKQMAARGISSLENTGVPQGKAGIHRQRDHRKSLMVATAVLIAVLGGGLWAGRSLLGDRTGQGAAGGPLAATSTAAEAGALPSGHYVIALEGYADAEPAQRRVVQIRDLGFHSYLGKVTQPDQTAIYTVYVVGFKDENEMRAALARLQTLSPFPNAHLISMD